ncbi:PLDc N-terminal domain-containing protein [Olivibacter jilunii]|uniref:PLDc N-terminal domain-containing protein n=1 Tax=Olivibacter jilunii TaxID=985016 RepID=UPI00102F7C9A
MIVNFLNIGSVEVFVFVSLIMAIGIYTLYQCMTNPRLSSKERLLWLCAILVIPLLGCVCYLLFNKNYVRR